MGLHLSPTAATYPFFLRILVNSACHSGSDLNALFVGNLVGVGCGSVVPACGYESIRCWYILECVHSNFRPRRVFCPTGECWSRASERRRAMPPHLTGGTIRQLRLLLVRGDVAARRSHSTSFSPRHTVRASLKSVTVDCSTSR
jgi:hypothetical protein